VFDKSVPNTLTDCAAPVDIRTDRTQDFGEHGNQQKSQRIIMYRWLFRLIVSSASVVLDTPQNNNMFTMPVKMSITDTPRAKVQLEC
jgi:hypothetical protein